MTPVSRGSSLAKSPVVTNSPVELQSRSPPTPGIDITIRDAPTARWSASSATGRTEPSTDRVVSTASHRQQDAAFGVDVQVGDRRCRELARLRDPRFILRSSALVHRDHRQGRCDERRGDAQGHERAQPPHRSPLHRALALGHGPLHLHALGDVGPVRVRESQRRGVGPFVDLVEPSTRGAGSSGRVRPIPIRRRPPRAGAALRMSSRASSIHPLSRSQAPSSASWAISTVGSRVAGSRSNESRRCRPNASSSAVQRPGRPRAAAAPIGGPGVACPRSPHPA